MHPYVPGWYMHPVHPWVYTLLHLPGYTSVASALSTGAPHGGCVAGLPR